MPTYLHAYTSSRLHTYTPTRLHISTPTRLQTYTPTRLHTYTPTHPWFCLRAHTYLHAYTPTRTWTFLTSEHGLSPFMILSCFDWAGATFPRNPDLGLSGFRTSSFPLYDLIMFRLAGSHFSSRSGPGPFWLPKPLKFNDFLHTYTPTRLHAYTPTHLHTHSPTRLHTCAPTRLHTASGEQDQGFRLRQGVSARCRKSLNFRGFGSQKGPGPDLEEKWLPANRNMIRS